MSTALASVLTLPVTPSVSRRLRPVATPAPRVMLVSEVALLRLDMARELMSGFELLPALGMASAERRLDAGASPEALIVDLDTAERSTVEAFLGRLVERGFTGPRILLSGRIRPEQAAFRGTCRTHFALGRPWRPGALRSLVESVLSQPAARGAGH